MNYLLNEKWKVYSFKKSKLFKRNYAVSSQGRIASFSENLKKDGTVISGSTTEGYIVIRLQKNGEYIAFLAHRAIAELFVKKPSTKHKFVIHLNHNKKDNRPINLKWATQEETTEHNKNNPLVKAAKQRLTEKGKKLTIAKVKQIKTILANEKRKLTYKKIAEKYGVSEMAITRINRGENWAHVSI